MERSVHGCIEIVYAIVYAFPFTLGHLCMHSVLI